MPEDYQSASQKQTQICVSIFTSATGKTPKTITLASVLEDIRTGRYATRIARLRQQFAHDLVRYNHDKKRLPAFTISGTAVSRTDPGNHSGLLQVDLDDLGSGLAAMRERLKNDPHVAFGFVSPSGQGLKLGIAIDGTRHLESFHAVERYFRDCYNAVIDPKCKDRLRLCFVSDDPDLWENRAPVPLAIPDNPIQQKEKPSPRDSSESCVLDTCVSGSLDTCVSGSLHHSSKGVLANIEAKRAALKKLDSEHPKLAAQYVKLVESRFQAVAHGRNESIVQMVPFLYRAFAVQLVLDVVGCFYDCNRPLFHDTREQHMMEAKAMLEAVIKTYVGPLNADERKIYESLEGHEQNAFRICRDLALLPKPPDREPLTFFLSFGDLGGRLGIHPMKAQRIMRQLEIYGLIKLLAKGTKRAQGIPGKAGDYRWHQSPAGPNNHNP